MDQNIMQKAAYLKGLGDGMDLDMDKKENKLLSAVIDLVDELASSVSEIQDSTAEMENELDEIAEELLAIEQELDDDDLNDEDFDEFYDGCIYKVECATCGEQITIDESLAEMGKITCPNCGEDIDFSDEECECDCDCGCDCDC